MNTKAKVIISAALLALLAAPASARTDTDDGFNFPRFTKERPHMGQGSLSPSAHLVNRPFQQR